MSQEQYNALLSNLLREKCALTKLRVELEERRGKLCRYYKGFGHLVCNCRNKEEGEKRTVIPQNKFEVLKNRVMQCGVEEKTVRSMRTTVVECFKCGEEGYKCRECPLWEKKMKRVAPPIEGKAYQEKGRPAHPIREKVQKREKRLRRVEEEKVVCPGRGKVQQEWKRTSVEKLRIKAEVDCGKGIPEEAQLLELGWMTEEVVVSYLVCKRCRSKGYHVEDNRGQGVIPRRKLEEMKWCGCTRKTAWPREAKVQ